MARDWNFRVNRSQDKGGDMIDVHPTSLIEGAGVVLAALSGIIEARRKRMDLVGVYAVAFITAFGGGTLRDLLLDRRPFYWQGNPGYTLLIFGLSVVYLYGPARIRRAASHPRLELPEQVLDALSLGLFTIVSTFFALEHGSTLFIASIFGVIGSTFGGVIRDIVCNEVPLMFVPGGLYASAAFMGSWALIGGLQLGLDATTAAVIGWVVGTGTRLLAIRYNLGLPQIRHTEETPTAPRKL
jgi:uncharacterized membrane protein YeiH